MTFQEYKDEIELIKEQNDTEFELYPLVVDIIMPTLKNLSKRYVFARRKTELGQIYYGISSFPDVAIMERDFRNKQHKDISINNWNMIRGCVETKKLDSELYELDDLIKHLSKVISENKPMKNDIGQLLGEILWYKKVLYTNGIKWKLFYIKSYNKKEIGKIIDIVSSRIEKEKDPNSREDFCWWKTKEIEEIVNKISEKTISENCLDNWEDFEKEINTIDWN